MHSAAESSAPTATAAAAAVRSAVDAAIETLTTKPGPMGPAGASSWSDPRSSQSMRSPPEWVEDPGSDVDEEVAAKHLVMQLLTHPQEAEAQLLREAEIEPGMNVSTAYIDAMVEAATDPGIGALQQQQYPTSWLHRGVVVLPYRVDCFAGQEQLTLCLLLHSFAWPLLCLWVRTSSEEGTTSD